MSVTLSNLIESLSILKARKKELEGAVKGVDKEIVDVESLLFEAMDADGVIESKSPIAKVTIATAQYPQVEDWVRFGDYILDNRYLHLLERRPAVLAYRELLQLNRPVPGVLPFTKRKITFKES